jgi:hypothetical protein
MTPSHDTGNALVRALNKITDDEALGYLERYFEKNADGQVIFTGSQFETFAGGGDGATANEITAEDLIAVSTLAVHVPARAATAILTIHHQQIADLLQELPTSWRLEALSHDEFAHFTDRKGPAQRLWDLLRNHANPWGVGPTTASKIMARKRPHLIPVYDSIIRERVDLSGSGDQWDVWWHALRANDAELVPRLDRIRAESRQDHLSILRTLDIILWMDGRSGVPTEETVGDESVEDDLAEARPGLLHG